MSEVWRFIDISGIQVIITADPSTLTRDTNGLVLQEKFDRADSSTIGNGWTENASGALDLDITSEELAATGGVATDVGWIDRSSPAIPDEFIMEMNVEGDKAFAGTQAAGLVWGFVADSENPREGYNLRFDNPGVERMSLNRAQTEVVVEDLDSTIDMSKWNTIRVAFQNIGSDKSIVGYYFIHNEDTNSEITPTSALSSALSYKETTELTDTGWGMALGRNQNADKFFLCGSKITVNGLSSDQQVQIDSGTSVTESGGSVVIDMSAQPLPATTITVGDSDSSLLTSLSPSGGIWGGDEYTFALGSTTETIEDGWSLLSEIDETWDITSDTDAPTWSQITV